MKTSPSAPAGYVPHADSLPLILADTAALSNNATVMAQYASNNGAALAPHVKSHMTPAIMRIQLDAGAWGLTAANLGQAEVACQAGASRILIANEVVGSTDARRIAALLSRGIELICLVDDPRGVQLLDGRLGEYLTPPTRLGVLVELGSHGGRAGTRTIAQGLITARAVVESEHLCLRGVETYEGLVGHDNSPAAILAVDTQIRRLIELFDRIHAAWLHQTDQPAIISAGASRYADRVIQATEAYRRRRDVTVLLRPGTYITFGDPAPDAVFADEIKDEAGYLQPALTLWAEVLSRPEAQLAIIGVGKRNIGDRRAGLRLQWVASHTGQPRAFHGTSTISGLDDQHAYLRFTNDRLDIGDLVGFSLSHPWSLDHWRKLTALEPAGAVASWPTTY